MKLEDLPNISVNIDSDTARAIAEQYIYFRYVQNFTGMLVLLAFFTAVAFAIKWGLKHL